MRFSLALCLLLGLAVAPACAQEAAVRAVAVNAAERFTPEAARAQEGAAWRETVPAILERIQPPAFPNRDCVVTDYGAAPEDSTNDDRPALLDALQDCAAQGGGRVVLPAGDYLSNGPIHFKSNINLHLKKGAGLRFGTDPMDYTPLVRVRWEGVFAYNYSPLLYAEGKENIAITGEGTIDGQTEGAWSKWKRGNDGKNQEADKDRLRRMGAEQIPVAERIFGHGRADTDGDGQMEGDGQPHYLRPTLIGFYENTNVLVEGVTLKSSPFWTTHFVLCENVTARNLAIRPGTTNDDGIDPESSRYVLIENNDIHTHDDPIAIKAGRDADGRAYPGTAYVVIRNNRLRSTVGGAMSIGSEMSGGVEQVFIQDNIGTNAEGRGLYLKSNLDRGGFIRHLYVRDLDLTGAENAFEITSDYKGHRGGNLPPDVHDIFLSDVRIWHATEKSMQLLGQEAAPIRRVFLDDVHIRGPADAAPVLRHARDLVAEDVVIGGRRWTPEDTASADSLSER